MYSTNHQSIHCHTSTAKRVGRGEVGRVSVDLRAHRRGPTSVARPLFSELLAVARVLPQPTPVLI